MARGIAAHVGHRVAHRREVDDARHAGEVLQDHARRREGDLLRRVGVRVPGRERLDVLAAHGDAVLVAQEVLEQDLQRERQPGDVVALLERLEPVDLVVRPPTSSSARASKEFSEAMAPPRVRVRFRDPTAPPRRRTPRARTRPSRSRRRRRRRRRAGRRRRPARRRRPVVVLAGAAPAAARRTQATRQPAAPLTIATAKAGGRASTVTLTSHSEADREHGGRATTHADATRSARAGGRRRARGRRGDPARPAIAGARHPLRCTRICRAGRAPLSAPRRAPAPRRSSRTPRSPRPARARRRCRPARRRGCPRTCRRGRGRGGRGRGGARAAARRAGPCRGRARCRCARPPACR